MTAFADALVRSRLNGSALPVAQLESPDGDEVVVVDTLAILPQFFNDNKRLNLAPLYLLAGLIPFSANKCICLQMTPNRTPYFVLGKLINETNTWCSSWLAGVHCVLLNV